MAMLIRPHKHIRKARAGNGEEILAKLESYLKTGVDEPIRILCGFWSDQQAVITYQELRQVVIDGSLNEETFREWSKDYSFLVRERLQFLWKNAVVAGAVSQPIISGLASYTFHADAPRVLSWISQRGAELVTVVAAEQREAISALLTQAVRERHSVDELARFIRPCIGLTEQQAKANLKYYDNIVRNLTEQHPRMKAETIQRRAREAAAKYAERQHRQRALTIARTEMATAYNRGAYEGILQAQEQHLLGNMVQRWCTSNDDMVCDQCRALEGVELELGKEFQVKGKRGAACVTPPAHPNCACAIEYIEVEKPQTAPMMEVALTESGSFRVYSDDEINAIAQQTEAIVSKYIDIPSKWSGTMFICDEGIKMASGLIVEYGKLWDCRILTKHETAPGIIMHEQIHARSISYYDRKIYSKYQGIEEAVVQLMTQEISQAEGIEVIASAYDEMVAALRKIGKLISNETEFEFVKKLLKMPVETRLDWLSEQLYDILGKNESATLEEYMEYSELLQSLYD